MSKVLHGWDVVDEALRWLGVPYRFGAEVASFGNPYETGWDCSEFVEFVMENLKYKEVSGEQFPDGSWNQYARCVKYDTLITIDRARHTPGALVFKRDGGTGQINHVAFTTGRNTTIEARGRRYGTGEWPWRDAGWSDAALIPRVSYVAVDG